MRFGLREFIFVLVLLAVPVASFIFVFKPRNEDIQQAQQEIEVKKAKLDQLNEVASEIDDLGVAIDEWRAAVEAIEAKLPTDQTVEDIVEQVWNLTRDNNLEIRSTKAAEAVPAATYMELPLEIEIFGDFDGFYQFLLGVEQLPRITRIHQLKIERADGKRRKGSKPGEEYPEGSMIATFTLSIFYEPTSAKQP